MVLCLSFEMGFEGFLKTIVFCGAYIFSTIIANENSLIKVSLYVCSLF